MARCDTCGNEYDKTFEVLLGDESHTFDCFECAIHMLAPICATCGCRVIGHGVEGEDEIFCCANCAERAGLETIRDRAEEDEEPGIIASTDMNTAELDIGPEEGVNEDDVEGLDIEAARTWRGHDRASLKQETPDRNERKAKGRTTAEQHAAPVHRPAGRRH